MRTSIVLLSLLGATTAQAIPFEITHQGRLFESGIGTPLDGTHTINLEIVDAPAGGNVLHTENIDVVFESGYFSIQLGADGVNTLDSEVFKDPTWLSVAVDGGAQLQRIPISSVPYAFVANVAENVSGGIVDASEIRISGTTVIDSNGVFTGTDTLTGLACAPGQLALFDGSVWGCGDDTGKSDAEIVSAVTASPIDLAAGSTLGGADISTGNHYGNGDVTALLGGGVDLGSSTMGGQPISTGAHYGNVDVDTHLGGGVALGTSTMGGQPISTGDHLTQSDVTGLLDSGVDVGAGSTIGSVGIASVNDVSTAVAGVAQEAKQDLIISGQGTIRNDIAAVAAVCSARPVYSQSCDDFSAKGWADEEECLTDGRWHLYATWTGGSIDEPLGSGRVKFYAASQQGAETKMRIGREWYEVSVRSNDSANAFWVFNKEKSKHMSFHMRSNGTVTDYHLSTNDSGYHTNWQGTDLGNWHYMQHNYSHQGVLNTSSNNGIGVWAKY